MKRNKCGLVGAGLLLAAVGAAAAADDVFAARPVVRRGGTGLEIAFALAAPTDVEVAVLGGDGRVARHLAAGYLGATNPPPAPLAAGLAQNLSWDGRGDDGRSVALETAKVRVRAGLSVKFGRLIGGDPTTGAVGDTPYRAPANGLVVDEQGNLNVMMMSDIHSHGNSGLWPWHLRRFDGQGNYIKTILPYPASTEPTKASGFALIDSGDGAFTPVNRNSLYPVFQTFGDELLNRMVAGRIVFVNSRTRQFTFFRTDGSNAIETRPMWYTKGKPVTAGWLSIQTAFAADGRTVYYSNVAGVAYDGKTPSDINPEWPQGRIYRQDLTQGERDPEPFFDLTLPDFERQKYWMPSAWDKKSAAAGIDVDAQGNLLVCDLVNQQVVEVGADGKQKSATPVPWPDKVAVGRKSGALYVVSRAVSRGHLPAGILHKIEGRGAQARVMATLPLQGIVGSSIALDESSAVPVIWLAGGDTLLRVEDRGNELAVSGGNLLNRDPNAILFVGYMDVDREQELVYVTDSRSTIWRFSGESGVGGLAPIKAVDLAIGTGGMIYTWGNQGGYHGPIARYTRDYQPAPLAATGQHTYGQVSGRAGRGSSVCGMDVDREGRVFVVDGSNMCHARAYGADGALVDFGRKITVGGAKAPVDIPVFIDQVSGYGGSLRIDPAGNVYLLQSGLPKGFVPPRGFDRDEAYRATAGTILKFGPRGGERASRLDEGGRGGNPLAFSGVLNHYPDCGVVSGWNCDGSCACVKPRFDVDDYGRLYIPNAVTFKISVRDNAGNEIVRFGNYGNFDSQGPASTEPRPEIPLGWPITVGAGEKYIYVGDCLNHRVVRVDRTWAAEEICAVR